jgi:hypothetical protein
MTLKTRFDDLPPRTCLLVLAALVLMLFGSLMTPAFQEPARPAVSAHAEAGMSDIKLYRKIIARVAAGEGYYAAVTQEHRRYGYPLKPFVTVRPPTLAWLYAGLGVDGTLAVFAGLIGAVALAWMPLLRGMNRYGYEGHLAFLLLMLSVMLLAAPPFRFYHESWAAPLIALSLALRIHGRVAVGVAVGLSAVLVRELAMPYLLLMAALAAYDRRWPEASAWGAATAAACLASALHAVTVDRLLLPGDLASQGWDGMGGWSFFTATAQEASLLAYLPMWAIKLALPLSLFGWIACRSDLSLRVAGLFLGYTLALMVFARSENTYWGILIMPYIAAGLAFAPTGIAALWSGALRTRAAGPAAATAMGGR